MRIDVRKADVLLVDYGMAIGSTMIAGLRSVRRVGVKSSIRSSSSRSSLAT